MFYNYHFSTIMLQLKQIFEQAFKKRKDIQEALTHFGLNAKKIAKVWMISSVIVDEVTFFL